MNISTLKIFKDIIETGSFSKAARLNYISQSAVSQQIKKLEIICKSPLLIHNNSGFSLTLCGKHFYNAAKKILPIYEETMENIMKMKGERKIKISSIYSAGIHLLEKYIEKFAGATPFVKLNVEYKKFHNVVEDIIGGKADFGIVAGRFKLKDKKICVARICYEEMLLIVSSAHRLCDRTSAGLNDIEGEIFITFEKDLPSRQIIDRWLKRKNPNLKKVLEINNIETIKSLVKSNRGIAVVPKFSVINESPDVLKTIKISDFKAVRPVFLIYDKNKKMSAEHNKFIALMRQGC